MAASIPRVVLSVGLRRTNYEKVTEVFAEYGQSSCPIMAVAGAPSSIRESRVLEFHAKVLTEIKGLTTADLKINSNDIFETVFAKVYADKGAKAVRRRDIVKAKALQAKQREIQRLERAAKRKESQRLARERKSSARARGERA